MQATSRESYAAAADALEAYARGAQADAVAATADEILAVARLLVAEPRLRRALSDPARSGSERAALLTGLLDGKVGEDTLRLLGTLAGGRWSSAVDLLDAVERLGTETVLAAAERAGHLGDVEDELFRFHQVAAGTPALAAALGDLSAEPERRAALARDLLDGKARPATVRLVELALAGFGGRSFDGALTRLVELTAARRDRQVAYVTVAQPLTEAEEGRLAARLAELYGRAISLQVSVEPGIIGGISVQVGSDLYDGTIARRLAETRIALAGRQ